MNPCPCDLSSLLLWRLKKKTLVVNHDEEQLTLTSLLIRTFPSYVYLLVLRVWVFCFSSFFGYEKIKIN